MGALGFTRDIGFYKDIYIYTVQGFRVQGLWGPRVKGLGFLGFKGLRFGAKSLGFGA